MKGVQLFKFVREFAGLSQKPVESLDSYIKTFWLDQIPRELECSFAAWAETDEDDDGAVIDNWLMVERPERPDPPPVAEELTPWVKVSEWQDSASELPGLHTRILNPGWSEDDPEALPQFLELEDHPDLKNAWDNYVVEEWWPWAEVDRRKKQVQDCYDELFTMHRTQVAMGEQYEFLLAVGCLHWNAASGVRAKRHLLVQAVTVDFDSVNAVVAVRSAGSAPEAQLETDMLRVQDRPSTDVEEDAESRRSLLGDNLFHRDTKTLLKAYVQGLDSEGVFLDTLDSVGGTPPQKPVVSFAPALIVRRRTSRSLVAVCDNIINQLQDCEDGDLPAGVRKLVGELGVDRSIFGDGAQEQRATDQADREVYFPLPFNDEQKRILDKLERQVGVLVQGPPGTGKSQTIANLICHLLATGKRILVTSQKAPALRVLRKKLPPEVADLCVMILGEGLDEQQELRRSVSEVASRRADWSPQQARCQIDTLRAELDQARQAEARAFERLCSIREHETFRHPAAFGSYEGTLGEIAQQVHQEAEHFAWFLDRLPDRVSLIDEPPPALPVELPAAERLLYLLRQIDPEEEVRAGAHLLRLSDIPSDGQFREMAHEEENARIAFEEQQRFLEHPEYDALSGLDSDRLLELLDAVDDFYGRLREANTADSDWEWRTAEEILRGNTAHFEALRTMSVELLDQICSEGRKIADLEVEGLGERSHRAVMQDAQDLKGHFQQGGSRGFWVFRPAIVKQCLYLTREATVDGRVCGTPDLLDRLIRWLQLRESIGKLREQWAVLTTVDTETLPLNQAIGRYQQLQARLDFTIELGRKAAAINKRLNECGKGVSRAWHDLGAVDKFRRLVAALASQRRLQEARHALTEAEKAVSDVCVDPLSAPENHRVRNAIHNRLVDEFGHGREDLARLWDCRRAIEERDAIQGEVARALPHLAEALIASFGDSAWDDRISQLQDAWNWVCADEWLSRMTELCLQDSLSDQARQARCDAARALSQLAAEKAWRHCMESMTEGNFQSLMAWRKASERPRGRTSKYAERNRMLLKRHMEECRDAIPAWVMPLYKVLDTVPVRPGIFDVVIIDEASQSGPDALFLAFLAKQIVVVGDDQQIRPENVGIDHNDVHQLQQRYLRDVPHCDIFDATQSLFSIAEVRFGEPVRLKEHFRCMPEIIAFSNRLCYQDSPLIPLRQYGNDRLTPVLRPEYVPEGYQESRKVNPVEAEKIVTEVEQCCEDPTYEGKTIGVISLLHTSDQDREIERRLVKRLDAEEIEKRNIVCGDAYDFQGDERDIIFLSMVAARSDQGRIATMADEKAKRRFNVAVSRACDQVFLFHSIQVGELGQNCLRRRLLVHMKQPPVDPTAQLPWTVEELRRLARNTARRKGNQPKPFGSWFEVDVFLAIADQGHSAIPQYEVHGYHIDIVIVGGTRKLAVECYGDYWHGPEQYEHDLHRQCQLERCDWEFFIVWESQFNRDPAGTLFPLWAKLEGREEEKDVEPPPSPVGEVEIETEEEVEHEVDTAGQDAEQLCTLSRVGEDVEGDAETEDLSLGVGEKQLQPARSVETQPNTSKKHGSTVTSVDQVLSKSSRELGRVICAILEECPNQSSKKDDLTKRVAKCFQIRTSGEPRRKLTRKIGWAITHLKKAGKVEEYKAKNIRIRLKQSGRQDRLF